MYCIRIYNMCIYIYIHNIYIYIVYIYIYIYIYRNTVVFLWSRLFRRSQFGQPAVPWHSTSQHQVSRVLCHRWKHRPTHCQRGRLFSRHFPAHVTSQALVTRNIVGYAGIWEARHCWLQRGTTSHPVCPSISRGTFARRIYCWQWVPVSVSSQPMNKIVICIIYAVYVSLMRTETRCSYELRRVPGYTDQIHASIHRWPQSLVHQQFVMCLLSSHPVKVL